jgi:hypothetical protein
VKSGLRNHCIFFPLDVITTKRELKMSCALPIAAVDVPYGADQTLIVVVDRRDGADEVRVERTDLEHTIDEMMLGCFSDPIRVICFNTLEHWMKDISAEVAAEIQLRCDMDGEGVPDHLSDFVERHRKTLPRLSAGARLMSQIAHR